MEPKTYSLDTLALICAGRTGATDESSWVAAIEKAMRSRQEVEPRYRVRDGGLCRNSESRAAVGTPDAELDVLEWQPVASDAKPALPIPFTACEFAAFTLAGLGALVIERFEDIDDEDALSEHELAKLGRNGADAKEVLREACRLRLEAYRRQRIEDGRDEDKQPRDADAAADWLLNDAQLELSLAAHRIPTAAAHDASMLATREQLNDARVLTTDPTTWFEAASAYIVARLRDGKFATAKELFNALAAEAGTADSPFDKGADHHRGSLYLRSLHQHVALKTLQNRWRELRKAAAQR